jgi:hypothetical protein
VDAFLGGCAFTPQKACSDHSHEREYVHGSPYADGFGIVRRDNKDPETLEQEQQSEENRLEYTNLNARSIEVLGEKALQRLWNGH